MPKPVSIVALVQKYDTREKCVRLLESLRWPEGPECPRCTSTNAYRIKSRLLHECGDCKHQYSVTSGTLMHRTRIPLTKWIAAVAIICNARKGVSAYQLQRDLGVTYKTAWYLGHRIRRAMRETDWLRKFTGTVELDETYVGGRERGRVGRGSKKKQIVFGVRERGGKVRLQTIPNITFSTIHEAVHKYVDTDAETVMADQLRSYDQLAAEFTMGRINHTKEYVRGEIHTQSIESIFAIVKRQVYGTHHKISPQFLPLYLSEISYRFNHRNDPDLFQRVLRNGLLTDKQLASS